MPERRTLLKRRRRIKGGGSGGIPCLVVVWEGGSEGLYILLEEGKFRSVEECRVGLGHKREKEAGESRELAEMGVEQKGG
jgi:hypothetical protein